MSHHAKNQANIKDDNKKTKNDNEKSNNDVTNLQSSLAESPDDIVKCCFCNEPCNPSSQCCGRCARGSFF